MPHDCGPATYHAAGFRGFCPRLPLKSYLFSSFSFQICLGDGGKSIPKIFDSRPSVGLFWGVFLLLLLFFSLFLFFVFVFLLGGGGGGGGGEASLIRLLTSVRGREGGRGC